MPSLTEMLKEYDTGLQLIIAGLWGIDQDLDLKEDIASQMAERFIGQLIGNEMADALAPDERGMIDRLIRDGGRLQRNQAERAFGTIREMGAARRQKERPDQNPLSIAEALYYKGLIGIAFLNGPAGIEEFVFIPDDVLAQLHGNDGLTSFRQLSSIPMNKIARRYITSDAILDHACILLAALRSGKPLNTFNPTNPRIQRQFLIKLLKELNLIDDDLTVDAGQTRLFLGDERCRSFSKIIYTWQLSPAINELHLLADLEFEGKWCNEPQTTRKNLIGILSQLPVDTWFSIESFIQWMHQNNPDFQRTSGDYEAWFIRERSSGSYLTGFENWQKVEGRLLEYMLTGPLFWMGFIDLGVSSTQPAVTVFKLSTWSESLFNNLPLIYPSNDNRVLHINNLLTLNLKRPFSMEYHYQISRFAEWVKNQKDLHVYQITPNSLHFAEKQGIHIRQILALINKLNQKPIPPNVSAALMNWQNPQSRISIERSYLIETASPDILEKLISTGIMGQFIEKISPTCARIRRGSLEKIQASLLEMGYLARFEPEV